MDSGTRANKDFFKGSNRALSNIVTSLSEILGIMRGEERVMVNVPSLLKDVLDLEVLNGALADLKKARSQASEQGKLKERVALLSVQKPLLAGIESLYDKNGKLRTVDVHDNDDISLWENLIQEVNSKVNAWIIPGA